jgi:4-azaleucine resistance transporter AzlC
MLTYKTGLKKGIPIALGYFPVSFSFGVLCVSHQLPLGLATLISFTNVTSSGQFAGVNLMLSQSTYFEIALTLLMINARYFLMSLSLSQKIEEKMTTLQRLLISFVVTDETFAIASLESQPLTFSYMAGLMTLPFLGWGLGSLCGELIMDLLPASVQGAMGIALYGMFLALIVPPSRKSKEVAVVVVLSVALHCLLHYVPLFAFMGDGFKLIASILISAAIGAKLYPKEENV